MKKKNEIINFGVYDSRFYLIQMLAQMIKRKL